MDAELGGIFLNYQIGSEICMALIDMVHAQTTTPEVTDSATGDGFVNDNIRQRRSISIYMQFYWFRDRVRQGQFLLY